MPTHWEPRVSHARPVRLIAAAAIAALALVGCGSALSAGSAAVLGKERIATSTVSAQVEELNTARGLPADSVNEALTLATIQRLVVTNLVDQAAERLGVSVSEGAIDTEILALEANAGGREALDESLIQSDIPPSTLADQIRVSLQVRQMGLALDPGGDPQTQNTAVFEYVVALSEELDVTISARFGTWDPEQLTLGPIPDDLSTPAASPQAG